VYTERFQKRHNLRVTDGRGAFLRAVWGTFYDYVVSGLRFSPVYGLRNLRFTVPGLLSTVFGLRSPFYGLWSAVSGLRSAVCGLRSTVYAKRSTVYGLRSTVYGLRCTVWGLRPTKNGNCIPPRLLVLKYYDRSLKWPLFPENLRWGGGGTTIPSNDRKSQNGAGR
jgi:hypothetical protein